MKGIFDMNKRRLILVSIAVLLASFFISAVSARGCEFVIEPLREVTENVELNVSDEVFGNLSVSNGFIDFYVTNPSGIILLCYNKTAFNTFNFAAGENGLFTMHLANTHQTENVNVTLNYAVHFKAVLQEKINVGYSVGTAHVISPPTTTTPLDWITILTIITSISGLIPRLVKAVLNFVRWLWWKWKYGKPRTPVVIKRF